MKLFFQKGKFPVGLCWKKQHFMYIKMRNVFFDFLKNYAFATSNVIILGYDVTLKLLFYKESF